MPRMRLRQLKRIERAVRRCVEAAFIVNKASEKLADATLDGYPDEVISELFQKQIDAVYASKTEQDRLEKMFLEAGCRVVDSVRRGKIMTKELTAQSVFEKAFEPWREPRSDAYKQGVLACLRIRFDGMELEKNPYTAGSAESDAYYAGFSEGRTISPVVSAP